MMMTKKEKKRVPELRFVGFEGEWEKKAIENTLTIASGKDYKHLEEGDIPVYGTGGLMTKVNDYLYDGESIGIGRKGTIDKPVYLNGKFWTVDTLFYTHSFIESIPKFIFYQFQRINWYRYNEASGVPSLSRRTIDKIKINLPKLNEQQKIATFLTTIDTRIQQLEKKKTLLEQYKKGVMQKIFSQKIRFKTDSGEEFGEWEEKRLGELGEIITGKTPSTSNPDLWSGDIHFVTPTDIDGNKYQYKTQRTVARTSKMKVLPLKSILFTCIASIGKMSLSTKPCITNQQINSIVPYEEFDNEFVYYSLLNMVEYIKSTQSTNTLPIINKTEFSKFKINVPKDLEEQTKIAQFLSALDRKIAAMDGQIEKTKEWKKGLLQRMFV